MRILAIIVILAGLASGQTFKGNVVVKGSVFTTGAGCGPPNYSCFNATSSLINFSVPGPNWGTTGGVSGNGVCNWTSAYTVQLCGNLTGANVAQAPADFGTTMIRCTDAATVSGHPEYIWTTYDAPGRNAWNTNDTAFMPKVTASGLQYVMVFNPNTQTCTLLTNGGVPVTFAGGAWFSHTSPTVVFWYDGTVQTRLQQSTVNLSTGSVSTSPLFDFNQSTCLTNAVNGYTGGSFPENGWTGTPLSSLDDSTFGIAFSQFGAQGTGAFAAAWTVGQSGCDLYNTLTNIITHNGTLVGTVSNAAWGGANGGLYDEFTMHDAGMSQNPAWMEVSGSQNAYTRGTPTNGPDFWQIGTTNVQHCGISAPDWKTGTVYALGDRVVPLTSNAGGFMYQIVTGSGGTSSAAPTWNQTPNTDSTSADSIPWHNIGIGSALQYFCEGHAWGGYSGTAPGKHITFHYYASPLTPQTQLLSLVSGGDQHFSNTNGNTTDSADPFGMSSDVGTGVNLLDSGTPYPTALYDELYFMGPLNFPNGTPNCVYDIVTCPNGTGSFKRAAHNWNTGWHQVFDVQFGMTILSQTGKWAALSTDGMGQFGNLDGTHGSCNVGAPDWVKNATGDGTTTYTAGYKMYPNPINVANVGDYIYQIQSCSGACQTGATHPTWVQNATVAGMGTFTDGTITWQGAADVNTPANTAKQNCRADIVMVKLFR